MNLWQFELILYFGLFYAVRGIPQYFYPPVFWHMNSCPFSRLAETHLTNSTKEFYIKVLPYTGMNIVCPSEASVNTWRSRPLYTDSLYENLWHVNKAGYDKCEVNDGGKLLLVCNNPSYVKKLQFGFHPRYSAKEPRFIPGKHYYFISTSVGYPEDLRTRKTSGPDGHCLTNHMKLHIYVCNPKVETCLWEQPICEPPKEIQYRMEMINGVLQRPRLPSPPTTESTSPITKSTSPITKSTSPITKLTKTTITMGATSEVLPPQTLQYREECKDEASVHLVMNFVLGGVILFLILIVILLACALSRTTKQCTLRRAKSTESKQTRMYESVPVKLPPNMVPIGSAHGDYMVYTRPATSDSLSQTNIRTPSYHNYEAPMFCFPDVSSQRSRGDSIQRSLAGSTHAKCATEQGLSDV